MRSPEEGEITDLERYKRVCSQIDYFANRAADAFRLFIQLSLATVGGYAWLKTHSSEPGLSNLVALVPWIISVVAFVTACEIISDLISWWGYRVKEAELLNDPRIKPKFPRSGRRDIFRVVILAVVAGASHTLLR